MVIDVRATRQSEIDSKRKTALAEYPALWQQMIDHWRHATSDTAWLMYAANYLFHTAGVRWAIDPYALPTRFKHSYLPDFEKDLSELDVVVFTHAHADHLDLNLVSALQNRPITWVIPAFMLEKINQAVRLPQNQIVVPQAGIPLHVGKLTLLPFDGQHFHNGNGVPEMGYLANFNHKNWLFPADTRVFDVNCLPPFTNLDGVFAHLWLGKACALQSPPPLLDAFCSFFAALKPTRMVVTHLEELGRDSDDYWTDAHYQLIAEQMHRITPDIHIQMAKCGQKVEL